MARGGKRKGAGRVATGLTTKLIRIPVEIDKDYMLKVFTIYQQYKFEATNHTTSPRWDALRQMIEEIEN